MERRIITIDECMSMSQEELNEFLKKDEMLLSQGIGDRNESNVDFQGMTIQNIAKKHGCYPMEEVFGELRQKLSRKIYEKESNQTDL